MPGKVLLSTAYLPNISYFSLFLGAYEAHIEACENYVKQSYRNRCCILSAHGKQLLIVPVLEGSRHKVPVREAKIDYSRRWQQVHLRAIISSYKSSPYFDYYFGEIENVISAKHSFLWDLNTGLLNVLSGMFNSCRIPKFTESFLAPTNEPFDYRYNLPRLVGELNFKNYTQVFSFPSGFIADLSIIDLLFNQGPDAHKYLVI